MTTKDLVAPFSPPAAKCVPAISPASIGANSWYKRSDLGSVGSILPTGALHGTWWTRDCTWVQRRQALGALPGDPGRYCLYHSTYLEPRASSSSCERLYIGACVEANDKYLVLGDRLGVGAPRISVFKGAINHSWCLPASSGNYSSIISVITVASSV
jgi:hypothetical protein